ncbi:hypothetical protein DFJ58DRAFT_837305 [Suillus subalutaceus]|uniref:uncharacterized protein n=1 Tax=Suillus subalutaceus TaxID=48586 RepID=UPI001B8608ED|nr:uncharacterized protein DFJ58DRAFT_837305 [Suillus subalutaceus]KAG1871353.1 hypothetical protein DFJ58DRAFT_837305 [Suillus subalutaceus]
MSQPADRQVRFDLPMDTDDESSYAGISQSPTSNADVTPKAFYFGIGLPPGPQTKFNFGMDIQGPSAPSPLPRPTPPKFNFGMDIDCPAGPLPTASAPLCLAEPHFAIGVKQPRHPHRTHTPLPCKVSTHSTHLCCTGLCPTRPIWIRGLGLLQKSQGCLNRPLLTGSAIAHLGQPFCPIGTKSSHVLPMSAYLHCLDLRAAHRHQTPHLALVSCIGISRQVYHWYPISRRTISDSDLRTIRRKCFNSSPLGSKYCTRTHLDLPFNFVFDLHIPAAQPATPPALIQEPFNFSHNLAITIPAAQPATPTPIQEPFNFGLNLAIPTQPQPAIPSTTPQPFNLGFNIPIKPKPTAGTLPVKAPPATVSTSQHVGYNINNEPFQFGCEALSPIGQWTPVPIPAPALISVPAAPPAVPIANLAPYKAMSLLNAERSLQSQTRATLIDNAKQAAIKIVERLNGDKFDKLAQLMASSMIQDANELRDPTPDEMLGINRVMLSAFCESQDRLASIFKDLISLHHIAQVHDRVAPAVAALMKEVERAEANAAKQ